MVRESRTRIRLRHRRDVTEPADPHATAVDRTAHAVAGVFVDVADHGRTFVPETAALRKAFAAVPVVHEERDFEELLSRLG